MQSISTIGLAPKLNDSDLFARIIVQNQQGIGPEIVRMFEVQAHTHRPAQFGRSGWNGDTEA